MLKEIQSNVFKNTNGIRPKIEFKPTLNVVNGSNTGTNSIGKSTLLMCIDFALGGKDYYEKLKTVINNIKDHELNFAFEFNGNNYYFCRATNTPDIISICDENYRKTGEQWSIKQYTTWLNTNYNNTTLLSFRELVSLYTRVYNRENMNELKPLRSFDDQTDGSSIEVALKLFNLYDPIKDSSEKAKEASNKKTAFTDAQKYEFIPNITKTKYKENLKLIEELLKEKETLAEKSEKGLLELTSSQAEQISKLKEELSTYKRQRGKLYNQLNTLKKDKEDNKESLEKDFTELREFFPNINIEKLETVEEFHRSISAIMMRQLSDSEKNIWNLISLLNMQIESIEKQIEAISQVKHVSKVVLDAYSKIDAEIAALRLENEKFDQLDVLKKDCTDKNAVLTNDTMKQAGILENLLNNKMIEVNSYIFGENYNAPEFHILTPKSYTFHTPNDDGAGTNYKGMIVMDIATLNLTPLPLLVHDSDMLKKISDENVEKIFELYLNAGKQIFVAIDKGITYSPRTQEIINNQEIIRLSSGGNELFGISFSKKGDNK